MKKVTKSQHVQARRQRALDRFTISPVGDAAYQARKAQELAALKSTLGV